MFLYTTQEKNATNEYVSLAFAKWYASIKEKEKEHLS